MGRDQGHHGDHQHRGEMHHGRADEGLQRRAILLGEDARANRGRDEHEADQGRRRRADQNVEVVPILDQLRERGIHNHRDRRALRALLPRITRDAKLDDSSNVGRNERNAAASIRSPRKISLGPRR